MARQLSVINDPGRGEISIQKKPAPDRADSAAAQRGEEICDLHQTTVLYRNRV